ncbi:YybH family protein [Kineobactrum salinum]|uniref:SnoaL-like domain-containing protein n=1 Tax=Kineobactrum salinum TaxID=2708301 RepID=A0A6C0U3S0_9GAMM|nr:nuclear transport factor 2 family protein [Kineobactrum salinum]QIB66810.1 hypothetical protein G3T16_16840 [Kineobactrum salinum]
MRNPESEAEILRIEKLFNRPDFDIGECLDYCDPKDFVSFDFLYNIVGKEAHRKHLESMRSNIPKLDCEFLRMEISAGDDHGFANYILHVTLYNDDDSIMYESNMRVTICYRKSDGKWYQVAQHASVPIDLQTGVPDLKSVW